MEIIGNFLTVGFLTLIFNFFWKKKDNEFKKLETYTKLIKELQDGNALIHQIAIARGFRFLGLNGEIAKGAADDLKLTKTYFQKNNKDKNFDELYQQLQLSIDALEEKSKLSGIDSWLQSIKSWFSPRSSD